MEDSALKLFNFVDDEERNGKVDLVSEFIFCAHLLSVVCFYSNTRSDLKEKCKIII